MSVLTNKMQPRQDKHLQNWYQISYEKKKMATQVFSSRIFNTTHKMQYYLYGQLNSTNSLKSVNIQMCLKMTLSQ